MKILLATSALVLAGLTATVANAAPVTEAKSSIGTVITGENGLTLYTFKKDKKNVSNCYKGCAERWPPLLAGPKDKPAGDYTIVKRKTGTLQWAKGGMPLYFWFKDVKSGDITGHGVAKIWHAARP